MKKELERIYRSSQERQRQLFPPVLGKNGQETTMPMPCLQKRSLACPQHWNYHPSAAFVT